jgi:hypothetical protein
MTATGFVPGFSHAASYRVSHPPAAGTSNCPYDKVLYRQRHRIEKPSAA